MKRVITFSTSWTGKESVQCFGWLDDNTNTHTSLQKRWERFVWIDIVVSNSILIDCDQLYSVTKWWECKINALSLQMCVSMQRSGSAIWV